MTSKMPTKSDWSLEGPSPEQVQTIRVLDGEERAPFLSAEVVEETFRDEPCRFSGNGHEGCFVAPVNRHGGPCVPCWARARQRMHEQAGYYAELKQARAEIAKLKGGLT